MAIKKTAVKKLLFDNDWDGLLKWWIEDRSSQRIGMSLLFVNDPLIIWRIIQARSIICEKQFTDDLEFPLSTKIFSTALKNIFQVLLKAAIPESLSLPDLR